MASGRMLLDGVVVKRGLFVPGRSVMRETALKVVLGVVGVVFVALAYPMVLFMRQEAALSMMLSVYVTLGVFLLLAVRRPRASRSVIAFAAWSSLVHAVWMGAQCVRGMVDRGELIGCAVLAVIGLLFLLLLPRRENAG